jgi:hypothetical protein
MRMGIQIGRPFMVPVWRGIAEAAIVLSDITCLASADHSRDGEGSGMIAA